MSGYIGPLPVPQGIQRKQSFTATAGQTTFNTNGYTDGNFITVYLNGVRLINGTDYTATNGSDVVLTTAAAASDVLDFETFQTFSLVDQTFDNVTLKNPTHEDTDGGRESAVSFKGEQSGGEISTLAQIQASHDGTADDQKGDLIFKTNDGSDNNAPTEVMRLDSSGDLLLGTTTSPSSTDVKQVISASSGAFTQFSVNGGAGSAIGSPAASQMALYTTTGNVGSETYTERMRIGAAGEFQLGGTTNAGFIDFDGSSVQLNTQRNPNTGAFVNTGRAHTSIGMFDGNGTATNSCIKFGTAAANNTTATERWRITHDGHFKAISNGNGIDFSATEGSGATGSILDDYEEGLYTATITPSTSGSITVNSSYDTMSYTKIGRQVTVNGRIRVSAVSSPVGQMINVSLPFVVGTLAKESERAMPTVLVQNAAQDTSNYIGHPTNDGVAFTQIGRSNSYGTNAANDFDGNELVTVTLTYFTD